MLFQNLLHQLCPQFVQKFSLRTNLYFYLAKNILTPRYFNYKLHNIKKLYTFPYSFNMSRLRYKKQRHGQNCNIIKTGSHKISDTCGICRGCLSAASSAGAASVSFVNKLPYSFYGRRFVYAALLKNTYKFYCSIIINNRLN